MIVQHQGCDTTHNIGREEKKLLWLQSCLDRKNRSLGFLTYTMNSLVKKLKLSKEKKKKKKEEEEEKLKTWLYNIKGVTQLTI